MGNKLVCAFPGQGIQQPGMSKAIEGTFAWKYFEEASEILGYDLGTLCQEGPEEKLTQTEYAQVAIFVTSYALWQLVAENYRPDYFVGHSLGEITALAAAGAFTFTDGVGLVALRGKLMGNQALDGGMLAVLGLTLEEVQELCAKVTKDGYVQVANENSPLQTVVSGEMKGLELLAEQALKKGAKRVVKLNVSGPFHSRLMEQAAEEFSKAVASLRIEETHTPVLSNDGQTLLTQTKDIRWALVKQMTHPVRFTTSVQKLVELGVNQFVEISPKPLLMPLARRIEPGLNFTLVRDGGM